MAAFRVFLPLALLAAGCTGSSPPRPNLLLITVDTLRADRLGSYGYELAATPTLDRLAETGVRFAEAVAHTPLTLPSHATLFTGLYPARHGIRDNGGFFLEGSTPTLAELLRDQGYETAAFVSSFVLDSKWGLDRGFTDYHDQFDLSRYERISLGNVQRPAGESVSQLLSWLREERAEPFFAWLHLYDPHAPYEAPEPFRSQMTDRPYDAEIAYADAEIGRVLRLLEENGLAEETLVVVTSDHGEGLGEHDELTHGNFVYESTLRVPLILRLPGERHAGAVVDPQVGLVDLYPSLAELMGMPAPTGLEGRSFVPLLSGGRLEERSLLAESFYPRLHYGWSEVVALRDGRYKYIDTPRPELYDLERDPRETVNLASERAGTARELREQIRALEMRTPTAVRESLDPETERGLRALGYVGGSVVDEGLDRAELPDPKDKIHLIRAIAEADRLGADGFLDEAVALLGEVIEEDPSILDAHLSLGNKFSEQGLHEEAIGAFRRCLELDPEYVSAIANLALSYRRAGRLEEAELGFLRVQELDPENRQAFFNLGEIYLLRKDYAKALEQFRDGLERERESPVFLRQAGIAYYYLGQSDRAEARLREALELSPGLEGARFMLALLHEGEGTLEAAEAAYRGELSEYPDNLRAAFNLANLYGKSGRFEEQIALLERTLEVAPEWADGYVQLAKAYRDTRREELYHRALAASDRAIALGPSASFAPLAHFLRAELLESAGRPEEARRAFERGRKLAESK